jgi:hypothetical protein
MTGYLYPCATASHLSSVPTLLPPSQVVRQLCSNLDVLRTVYEAFADFVEGVQVLKLATSGTGAGGLYKLLELYDVTPTYLSKVEAKVLFTLTLHAQVGW